MTVPSCSAVLLPVVLAAGGGGGGGGGGLRRAVPAVEKIWSCCYSTVYDARGEKKRRRMDV